jgi:hypothetical protein
MGFATRSAWTRPSISANTYVEPRTKGILRVLPASVVNEFGEKQ